jgi:alkylated DNA repair dioxygenase AlkB
MEEACAIIEQTVNTELSKRDRFPLEYPGNTWQANVAAANCYEGMKEGVGAHSDQLTYLGPYPTIASLSLGAYALLG